VDFCSAAACIGHCPAFVELLEEKAFMTHSLDDSPQAVLVSTRGDEHESVKLAYRFLSDVGDTFRYLGKLLERFRFARFRSESHIGSYERFRTAVSFLQAPDGCPAAARGVLS
jgi:hypothetical protein